MKRKLTKEQRWRRALKRFTADMVRNFRDLEGYEDEFANFRAYWWRTH